MTNYPKFLSLVPVIVVISLLNSSHFVDCAEAEGKAIYSSSPTHNPISTYFKEQKNKLRPYFATRPGDGLDLSDLYPEELTVHDDTQSAHSSYYDSGGGGGDRGASPPAPSPYRPPDLSSAYPNPTQEDHHTNYLSLNPSWDMSGISSSLSSTSPDDHAESSNAMYSVVDPHTGYPTGSSPLSGGNPGGYFSGGDRLQGSQYMPPPPSFHGPGLPGGSSGSGGYYGGGHHDNSIYSQPPSPQGYYGNGGGAGSPPVSSSPHHHHPPPPASNADKSNDNLAASSNHVDSPTDTYTYPPGGGGQGSNGEYQSGMIMDDELIDMEDHNPQIAPPDYSPYDYQTPYDGGDGDELFAAPGDDAAAPATAGGAGSSDTAAQTTNDAAPAQPAPENPLNFLNLVGTDFQPGRLVNIFFGLFIMLFMIIFHGYALWILGIAYLPGTRSLGGSSQWEMNWDKVNEACELVLDALEYWENKLDEK